MVTILYGNYSTPIVPAFLKELIYKVLGLQVSLLELNRFEILLEEWEEGHERAIKKMNEKDDDKEEEKKDESVHEEAQEEEGAKKRKLGTRRKLIAKRRKLYGFGADQVCETTIGRI
ncbi:hypothetical protein Tco_1145555 [Tanacetum coccineum]